MNKILKYILPAAALLLSAGMTSCLNDLHVTPIDPTMQTTVDAENLFNKCYANFGLAGNPDSKSEAGELIVGGISNAGKIAVVLGLVVMLVVAVLNMPKKEEANA